MEKKSLISEFLTPRFQVNLSSVFQIIVHLLNTSAIFAMSLVLNCAQLYSLKIRFQERPVWEGRESLHSITLDLQSQKVYRRWAHRPRRGALSLPAHFATCQPVPLLVPDEVSLWESWCLQWFRIWRPFRLWSWTSPRRNGNCWTHSKATVQGDDAEKLEETGLAQ